MSKKKILSIAKKQRVSSAFLLAKALEELYPEVEPLNGGELSYGFFYEIFFPHPLTEPLLSQIEEKMKGIVRKKGSLETFEMAPFSAKELLFSKNHYARGDALLEKEGLVQMAKLEGFIDFVESEPLKDLGELKFFKLLSIELNSQKTLKVTGVVQDSKEELKKFLKSWGKYPNEKHEIVGKNLGLWSFFEEKILWREKGIEIRENLKKFFRQNIFKEACFVELPFGVDEKKALFSFKPFVLEEKVQINPSLEEGLFLGGKQTFLKGTYFFEDFQKALISSLQTIGKTLNILGFKFLARVSGQKRSKKEIFEVEKFLEKLGWDFEVDFGEEPFSVEFLAEDKIGRFWPLVSLSSSKSCLTSLISVERNLALLVEMQGLELKNFKELKQQMSQEVQH